MTRRILSFLLLATLVLAVTSRDALAFCPMCRTVIEGATGAQQAADSLTLAAFVLLAPPVMIFAALFGLFYHLRSASGDRAPTNEKAAERAEARALTR